MPKRMNQRRHRRAFRRSHIGYARQFNFFLQTFLPPKIGYASIHAPPSDFVRTVVLRDLFEAG